MNKNLTNFSTAVAATTATFASGALAMAASATPEDIRDIRGPLAVPAAGQWGIYAAIAVGALALVCGAWGIYRWRRGRRVTFYQLTKQRLAAARSLIAAGQGAELADAVSDAVRAYIEVRFGVRAAHKTTDDFLSGLLQETSAAPGLLPYREDLALLLLHCDLAKFAARTMSTEQMNALHGTATAFVDRSHEDLQRKARDARGASKGRSDSHTIASAQTKGVTT